MCIYIIAKVCGQAKKNCRGIRICFSAAQAKRLDDGNDRLLPQWELSIRKRTNSLQKWGIAEKKEISESLTADHSSGPATPVDDRRQRLQDNK